MRLRPEGSGFVTFTLIIAGVLVAAGIAVGVMSTVLHRAYATVTPYTFEVNASTTLQSSPDSATLPYQKISVNDTATKTVTATGSQHVENHAFGTITVYNAYSTSPQRLITNTRFETKEGFIFRTHTAITIPGYTMKAGVKVPGSVDVVVYADQAGDSYNIDLSDFTIPGLQGSPQYSLMTARSKTPMSGGFIGEQAVVDPTLRSQTEDSLKADLDRSLRSKVAAATVAGTIIFPDTVSVTYTDSPDTVQGNNAVITVTGQANAPAFNENALAHALTGTSTSLYSGPLTIGNPQALSAHINDSAAVSGGNPVALTLSGQADLVASFNQSELAKDLAGTEKSQIGNVLPKYPGISNIDVKVYPFWMSSLPSDPSHVSITVASGTPAQ